MCALIAAVAWFGIAAVAIVCHVRAWADGVYQWAVIGMDRWKLFTPHLVLLSGT